MILQKYGSNVITASEAMCELALHNIDTMSLKPSVDTLYKDIQNKVKPECETQIIEEVVPQEDVEVVINEDEDMTIS